MGVGRALLFASLATIPGMILAVIGWAISGGQEEWRDRNWVFCYLPFFGCVFAGFLAGLRSEGVGFEEG
ncbi:MAG: hypothetical protein CMB67_05180 [Euryarchaeota archaeon]|nr:hypothetical protein [Euryarchaeota archaeon]|tara:strand:+ start:359 stop:565 length:207 start_codon:yes stop_codon:yes gene_type:complete